MDDNTNNSTIPNIVTADTTGEYVMINPNDSCNGTYIDYSDMDDTFLRDTDICITASSIEPWKYNEPHMTLGEDLSEAQKIYIVEPWQSKNPIKVQEGLWVSLEHDLVSYDEIKRIIIKKLMDDNPDALIKMGINIDNVKLVKNEVNIEINREL